MGVGGQHHAPADLPSAETRYPLYSRLGNNNNNIATSKSQIFVKKIIKKYLIYELSLNCGHAFVDGPLQIPVPQGLHKAQSLMCKLQRYSSGFAETSPVKFLCE